MSLIGADMIARRTLLAFVLLAVVPRIGAVAARAAEALSPRDLIGADAAIVVEAQRAEESFRKVRDSAWFARLQKTDLFRKWQASPQHEKLHDARQKLAEAFGRPAADVLADLFGRHVAVAIYPQEKGPAAGVLITQAASDPALDSILEVWNRIEPADLRRREHLGREYTHRTRAGKSDDAGVFFVRFGPVIALSDREAMIRRVIELSNALPRPEESSPDRTPDAAFGRLAESSEFRACVAALPATGVIRIFAQPQLMRKPREAPSEPSRDPAAKLLEGWSQCRSIGAAIRFDGGWLLDTIARFPESSASPEWERFVERSAGGPKLMAELPANTLAAWAGRIDLSQTTAIVDKVVPEKARRELAKSRQVGRGLLLGRDLLTDVLPALGPDMAAAVLPATAEESLPSACAVLLVNLAKRAPGESDAAPLPAALDNALNTGLNFLAATHNADDGSNTAAVVRSKGEGPGKIRWLDGLDGIQPAFAVGDGRLALATAAEAIAAISELRNGARLSETAAFRSASERFVTEAGHVVFIHAAALRALHDRDRAHLVRHAVRRHGLTEEEAAGRLDELRDVLNLFDTLFASAKLGRTEVRLSAGGILGTP